jgi:hypothetical protein
MLSAAGSVVQTRFFSRQDARVAEMGDDRLDEFRPSFTLGEPGGFARNCFFSRKKRRERKGKFDCFSTGLSRLL